MQQIGGNEDGLIGGNVKGLAVAGYAGRALNHNPMFGAVLVFLQGNLAAGIDADPAQPIAWPLLSA